MVWRAADRPNFVEDVQAMRRRVEQNVPAKDADRQLKLGAGGLRDVEFSVQLLQLVHGRSDVMLRSATTLARSSRSRRGGTSAATTPARWRAAYGFLRTLEHRIQLHRLRRTHVVPDADDDLRRIGRSMGCARDPAAELDRGAAGGTAARCAGCTRSSSTGRCSTPWPGSTRARPG